MPSSRPRAGHGAGRAQNATRGRFTLPEITSALPDDSREAEERAAARQLADLRGRMKAAREARDHARGGGRAAGGLADGAGGPHVGRVTWGLAALPAGRRLGWVYVRHALGPLPSREAAWDTNFSDLPSSGFTNSRPLLPRNAERGRSFEPGRSRPGPSGAAGSTAGSFRPAHRGPGGVARSPVRTRRRGAGYDDGASRRRSQVRPPKRTPRPRRRRPRGGRRSRREMGRRERSRSA